MVFLRRLLKNRRWLILVLFIIISIAIVNITSKKSHIFKKLEVPVVTVFSPVQKTFSNIVCGIKENIEMLPQFFYLREENEVLKRQVAQLTKYKQNLLEYQQENAELRKLLGFKESNFQYELEAAEVIARDSGNWFNVILIDKGERHGIKKNMAVITDNGLVGTTSVTANNSKVVLITDERSSVSAMIQRTRTMV